MNFCEVAQELVNLGIIWCFGFFFLGLHDDLDERSQQRPETLLALGMHCEIVQRPDTPPMTCAAGLNAGMILFLASSCEKQGCRSHLTGLVHQ